MSTHCTRFLFVLIRIVIYLFQRISENVDRIETMVYDDLDADVVLERIETQRMQLGLSRNEVAVQAGILPSTFLSNFKKHKIPMFADLFRIAAALGVPVDALLYGYKCKNDSYEDTNNILYWVTKSGGVPAASSLLMHCSDKTAICKTLQVLNDNSTKGVLSDPLICETSDDLCLSVFISFLRAEEVDAIHIYKCVMKILEEGYVSRYDYLRPLVTLLMEMQELENCLWDYKHLPVEYLWKEIDKKVKNSSVYSNKTKFLNDSGINSRTYSDYYDATRTKSSPSTETVWKVCALLNLGDLDTRIRSHLPGIGTHLENSTITKLIKTYEIQNDVLKENLKSLPFLAQFFDAIFSLGYGGLNQINKIAAGARITPYSDMMYSTERTRPHYFSCFYDENAREVEYAYGTDFARDKMHNSYGLEIED